MSKPLAGQRILVTGSTRGIGLAVAETLVEAGATVGVNGRSAASVESACLAIGSNAAIPLPLDLSKPGAGSALVQSFLGAAGSIDGLVNNAGFGRAAPFRAMTAEKWRETFALNLEAGMEATREAYTAMRKQGRGSIVNIASLAAHGPGKWMGADYAASKAGLVSLTKSLAFEAGRMGIRVNAVSPGFINTDLAATLTQEMKDGLAIPMKRLGDPCEVASVVLWLLSQESAYITGEVLHVDGGLYM